jgi:enamine deaminase RidA (YjgF/YER057c/UK114 family)
MKQISNSSVLNEAHMYGASFSRGVRVRLGTHDMLIISGTASIDANGLTLYPAIGNSLNKTQVWFQAMRAFSNVKALLQSEGATWKDIVKVTIYLKDIEAHYDEFNTARNEFFRQEDIKLFPASTCVEAKLCRPELLVEMECMAVVKME